MNVKTKENSASSSQAISSISNAELQYMLEGCDDDFRVDGRSCADFRPYSISGASTPYSSPPSALVLSNGSARISLPGGATDIICSTKAEIGRPALLHPNEGIVEVNVDYFSSSIHSNKRQRRQEETELSQIITRLVLPNAVSLKSLCILPGKYCWKVSIDVLVLADDGCVVDVASMAIYKALNNTVLPIIKPIPKETEGKVDGGSKSNARDDFMIESSDITEAVALTGATDCPIILTVCVLQQSNPYQRDGTRRKYKAPTVMVMDCRSEEEVCATTKVSVAIDKHGMICGVLKFGAGQGALPYRMLAEISDLAAISSKTVFQNILNADSDHSSSKNDVIGIANSGNISDFLHGHFNFQ